MTENYIVPAIAVKEIDVSACLAVSSFSGTTPTYGETGFGMGENPVFNGSEITMQ